MSMFGWCCSPEGATTDHDRCVGEFINNFGIRVVCSCVRHVTTADRCASTQGVMA